MARPLTDVLAAAGFAPRGVVHLTPKEARIYGGSYALLLGPLPSIWDQITAFAPSTPSLDAYSEQTITEIAAEFSLTTAFPFRSQDNGDYAPFYEWALRSGTAFASPIGMLVHNDQGLMISYRGAVMSSSPFAGAPLQTNISPCATCADRPCLMACPVAAFAKGTYDVLSCRQHIADQDQAQCMTKACAARRACPHTPPESRHPDHIAHLMTCFVQSLHR